jgi:putative inorganic carbon (HCO3(-)) transporter
MQRAVELLQDSRWLALAIVILSAGCVFVANAFGMEVNLIVIAILFTVASYYVIDREPVYGMILLLAATCMVPLALKIFYIYTVPVTTFIELINVVFFFSLMLKRKLRGITSFVGILVMCWFVIQLAEVVNPSANSRIASIAAFRAVIMFTLAFFASYSAIRTKADLRIFINGWIAIALIGACYGLYQEVVGLPQWDYDYATITEFRFKLLFTWGRLRKFGFFTSPGEFGQFMVYSGLICLVLAFSLRATLIKRVFLLGSSLFMFSVMMFSGSRTAMILVTVGIFIFAAITLKRSVLIAVAVIAMAGSVLIFKSYSSKTLVVMSTAFKGQEDNSMNVRVMNQQIIREYIKHAPIGFGLGAVGYYGQKYAEGTFLGSFPPDSEYVKIAVESGWIGFIAWLTIQFLIFSWGVNAYFSIGDRELRDYMVVPLVLLFTMIVAQYPQEFFRAPVLAVLYAFVVALIGKIKTLDNANVTTVSDDSFD